LSKRVHEPKSFATFFGQLGPVWFLVVIFLLNFVSRIILSPLLPTIEGELRISHGQAGFFFFLISLGYLIGLLGSGFIAARLTHQIMIIIAATGVGVALLTAALVNHLWAFRAGLFGLGLACGLYIPSALATITSLIDTRHWGKAIAVHELAPNVAFFIAPFLAEIFLKWASWRAALGCLGASSIVAAAAFARWGRGGEFPGESPASTAFQALLATPSFWLLLLLFALGISSTIGVYAMLPLYLVSERGMTPGFANTVVALSRVHGPVLGVFGGWVADRLGARRTIVASLTFTGIVTLLLGLISTGWMPVTVFFQPLLAVWFFPAGFAALAQITSPSARNLAVAFTVPFGFLIGAGGIPTFIGIMGDAGSFARGFLVTGALILSGGVWALLLRLPLNSPIAR
jgi:NNP family nitrate/nitrite transporter-like MFS transporter